jgi:polar amino acid transport system substrate-binding protein
MTQRAKKFLPNMHHLTFENVSDMVLAVRTGQATAMQMDTPIVEWLARNNTDFRVLPTPLGSVTSNAMFVKPGDFAWWLCLSTVVKEFRWGSQYADYVASFNSWFGQNPPLQSPYTNA